MKKEGPKHVDEESKFIRHFIFGAEDGLISTFGFLAGITGAHLSHFTIVVAGIAGVFAAGLSMGIGTYLSSKSQLEVHRRNIEIEKEEIKKYPEHEKKELEEMYRKKGFKGKELKMIVDKIFSNKKVLLNEMLSSELGIKPSKFENPFKSSLIMFATFIILALIPLFPYLVFSVKQALVFSAIFSLIALFLVGAAKTRITKKSWFVAGLEMLILGAFAAGITYYIGNLISGLY